MSDLPDTNGEVARERIQHARTYHSMAIGAQGMAGNKVAVRSLVSAAEMAVKAVYIRHETYFPRTHDTKELIDGCPDRSIDLLLRGYPTEFIEEFSINYLAPYVRDRPVPDNEFETCRRFAEQILTWATAAVDTLSGG